MIPGIKGLWKEHVCCLTTFFDIGERGSIGLGLHRKTQQQQRSVSLLGLLGKKGLYDWLFSYPKGSGRKLFLEQALFICEGFYEPLGTFL